jgi:hypothetical protein
MTHRRALWMLALAAVLPQAAVAAPCAAYTYMLQNNTTADANQVMANFNNVLTCANTALAPLSSPALTGAVGINVGVPSASLEIAGALNTPGLIVDTAVSSTWARTVFIKDVTQSPIHWGSYPGNWTSALQIQSNDNSRLLWLSPLDAASGASARIRAAASGLDIYTGGVTGDGGYLGLSQDTTGNIGIGTTSPDLKLSVNGDADKASGGTAWSVFSDARLKSVGGPYRRSLADIVKLYPVIFHYRKDNPLHLPSNNVEVGVIAQQAQGAFPETVTASRSGFLEFNMSAVQFAMINAFKELKTRTDEQSAEMNAMKMRIARLETLLVNRQFAADGRP